MPLLIRSLFLVCLVAQAAVVAGQSPGAIAWQSDLDAARATAEREQKLLLIHFYNDNCGPCRMLDATVFNQPTVAGAVHSQYVPVKLNTNEFPATAERFGISRVPTDVVITPEGRMIERMVSPATPMAYIGQVSGIASQYKQQTGRSFATAQATTTPTQPLNSAYARLGVPADNNSFTSRATQEQPGMATNPYLQDTTALTGQVATTPAAGTTQQAAPTAPASSPVAVANPYANQPVTPIEPKTSNPPAERYATAATTPAPKTAAQEVPTPAAAPQLPPNSPPLGFFGYCPVTMKKENRWQKGDPTWGCYHRGRTYLFASAENRDEFLAAGDEFAPALSGIDPVLAIDSNKVEPGKQKFGIEYEGKFYLFSSEDNLRKFYNQPQHYAAGVRQAMNAAGEGRTLR